MASINCWCNRNEEVDGDDDGSCDASLGGGGGMVVGGTGDDDDVVLLLLLRLTPTVSLKSKKLFELLLQLSMNDIGNVDGWMIFVVIAAAAAVVVVVFVDPT
jgi:hypothetical protein